MFFSNNGKQAMTFQVVFPLSTCIESRSLCVFHLNSLTVETQDYHHTYTTLTKGT